MKESQIIEKPDPQPVVRKNAENASDWEYREEARYLYDMAVLFRERLIDPIARIDRDRMPDPIISFDNLRNFNTLAAYTLIRNPQGLNYEITFNNQHYKDVEGKMRWEFGSWALLETLCHELVHEWQQTVGKDPVKVGKVYHNSEFVKKCESIGLHPKLNQGYHIRLADGVFEQLMSELGIQPPEEIAKGLPPGLPIDWFKWLLDNRGNARKGKSTLAKWICPKCDLKVRVGIKGNPELLHQSCGTVLVRSVEGLHQTIYKAEDY